MRLIDLRSRLRQLMNDPESVYWSNADLDELLVEAQEVYAEEVPFVKRTVTIPRRQAYAVYSLNGVAPNLMAPYRLWLPDLHRRLECVSLTNLDARHEEWLTVSGDPWWWAVVDWRQFVVWPVPRAGGWIQVDYYAWPNVMDEDQSRPEMRESQHDALLAYAEFLAYLRQWEVARAAERYQAFAGQAMHGEARANVEQTMSRLWARSTNGHGERR